MSKSNVRKIVNTVVPEILFGGMGDPGFNELYAAAGLVLILEELGYKGGDKDLYIILSESNVYGEDFFEKVKEDIKGRYKWVSRDLQD